MIVDSEQRQIVLDAKRSFCVSAPAGSGKTELLIQRYLALLARVSQPEQVLAITFTRKAAAEMRDRVLQALLDARDELSCNGDHQQLTRALALEVLTLNQKNEWQLIANTSRFNIKTIDSFCSQLTRQMPVLSEFGGQTEVVNNATELYQQAVVELFGLVGQEHPLAADLQDLLLHFDNDWKRVQALLVSMLGRREQWRDYVGVRHQADEAENYLLHTVHELAGERLEGIEQHLTPYSEELLGLLRYANENLGKPSPQKFPQPIPQQLEVWKDVRSLLLTNGSAGDWRKRIDKNMGFPAGKGEPAAVKLRLRDIIEQLRDVPGLREDLNDLLLLPEISSGNASWQLVLKLSHLLPRLAAELLLVFKRFGKVDHTQVTLSALQALGDDEQPTELALRLDYQLQHILVDEFQDTAISQYELVHRLTRGWGEFNYLNPDSPRTVMIVGDAMQSIYAFRAANVGLFLKARADGFNGLRLEHVELLSNFRSDPAIVDWVNDSFSQAFPAAEDVSSGQVRFTAAAAVRPKTDSSAVALHGFSGDNADSAECEWICQQVAAAITDDECRSVAILARSRGHFKGIIAGLKSRDIAYSAQDIDSLETSFVVQDLMTLCRALANRADRVAWLALLRAPWCGLTLADLHLVANAGEVPRYQSFYHLLENGSLRDQLSLDGQARLKHLAMTITWANAERDGMPLRNWIEQTWMMLGGPACVPSASAMADAERFFQLLEQADNDGLGLSLPWLQEQLKSLYVQAENPDSKVQLMTLHKAKGLEFDWVFLPATAKTTRSNDKPLLLWEDYTGRSGQRGFLLAADDHSATEDPSLFNWLRQRAAQRQLLENTRLVYVGVTRAVTRLFISASLRYDEKEQRYRIPPERSLLAPLWPVFESAMQLHDTVDCMGASSAGVQQRSLIRLDSNSIAIFADRNAKAERTMRATEAAPLPSYLNPLDRYTGTVVHLALEQLSWLQALPQRPSTQMASQWRSALAQLGLSGQLLEKGRRRVELSVANVLADPRGRWILDAGHSRAVSELALSVREESGALRDIVLDRAFVDRESGQCWLIDYKNSGPMEGESKQHFLQRERDAYRAQLLLYSLALESLWQLPVNSAIYFPALGEFVPLD